jgi:hypothetical protein
MMNDELRAQKKFPCKSTIKRWMSLQETYGHICPKAYIDEVRAYVHNMNPDSLPYSRSHIVRAAQRLGLSTKVGSSTSNEAYLPINMLKRERYWQMQYPYGIWGEDINNMIDIDEAGFKLQWYGSTKDMHMRICKHANTSNLQNCGQCIIMRQSSSKMYSINPSGNRGEEYY